MQGAPAATEALQKRLDASTSQPLPLPSSSSSSPHTAASLNSPASASHSTRSSILTAAEKGDLEALRAFSAESGGFEDRELRRAVWPALLGSTSKGKEREDAGGDLLNPADELASLPPRDDERQVRLDIVRSLVNFPHDVKDDEREELRARLETVILTVLRRHPSLQYFQGYHDIVSILLLVLDDDRLAISVAERFSLHHIRDSMGAGLEPTLGYLKLVHRIVQKVEPQLLVVINQAASMPFFALSWALTLLSHDVESVAVLARLFDFLLAHNPAMIAYLVVAILLTKQDDLLAVATTIGADDPAIIHAALSRLPNIVLHAPPSPTFPSRPQTPTSPSPTSRNSKYNESTSSGTDYDEDLMSSSSTSNLTDLTFSPTLTASAASTSDLSESLISVSEAEPSTPPSGLRQRRRPRAFSLSGLDDDAIHALDDSMLSDPDCDVSAFSFASLPPRTRTPSPPRTPPAHGEVLRSPLGSPSALPPPRTVLADDLIRRALELWAAHPLVAPVSSPLDDDAPDPSINASAVLGPNSCVFTYDRSMRGDLSDAEAEEIVRKGEGVVFPAALGPDEPDTLSDDDGASEADSDVEDDEFELVDSPTSTPGRRRHRRQRRKSRSSRAGAAALGGRLNLGPSGWLVVGGVAVATAAVAYGVYQQQQQVGSPVLGGGGLGTAGMGLGTAGGGLGGSPQLGGMGFAAERRAV
ncbi:hypothetical protein JCM10207_004891 [Rhodosporidiobolus poonsookiae]